MPIFKTVLILTVLVLTGGGAFVYSGAYDVAADAPHWTITHRLITLLRERSIAAHAEGIEVLPDLGDPERARRGAGNYDAMCVGCHLAPGLKDTEIRKGLYPQPPNLAMPADRGGVTTTSAAQQFWIIKHGVKSTGMPAWAKGDVDDATIWDIVALLPRLSSLSADEYRELVASSEGHSHGGTQARDGKDARPTDGAAAGHRDEPATQSPETENVESKHEDEDYAH